MEAGLVTMCVCVCGGGKTHNTGGKPHNAGVRPTLRGKTHNVGGRPNCGGSPMRGQTKNVWVVPTMRGRRGSG